MSKNAEELKKMFEECINKDPSGTTAEVHHLSEIMNTEELMLEAIKYMAAMIERSAMDLSFIMDKDTADPHIALLALSHIKAVNVLRNCTERVQETGLALVSMIELGKMIREEGEKNA